MFLTYQKNPIEPLQYRRYLSLRNAAIARLYFVKEVHDIKEVNYAIFAPTSVVGSDKTIATRGSNAKTCQVGTITYT